MTAPVMPAAPAEPSAIPQGLSLADPGLSGIQDLRPTFDAEAERIRLEQERSHRLRHTLLPSTLVLGMTLPALAAGWFALDRFSVVRDNVLGLAIPVTLAGAGTLFLVLTFLLLLKRPDRTANSDR